MQAPLDPVSRAFGHLRRAADAVPAPSFDERDDRLARLERLLVDHRDAFVDAIADDFSVRGRGETLTADVLLTVDAVRYARRHLAKWMERTPARPHPFFLPSKAFIEHLPRGVVGIIAPWNYPVNLALMPLAAALAAGNHVMLKPSELTPRTSDLLKSLLSEVFPEERVAVVLGGPEVAAEFSALPFDHLFFTGSTQVGRLVMQAAAKNLTPAHFEAVGAPGDTPFVGLPENSSFAETFLRNGLTLDREQVEREAVAAGRALVVRHPGIDAVVLECTNLPPYKEALKAFLGLPVYDVLDLLKGFYAELGRQDGSRRRSSAPAPHCGQISPTSSPWPTSRPASVRPRASSCSGSSGG